MPTIAASLPSDSSEPVEPTANYEIAHHLRFTQHHDDHDGRRENVIDDCAPVQRLFEFAHMGVALSFIKGRKSDTLSLEWLQAATRMRLGSSKTISIV
jgi:hypothetical protein